MNYHRSDKGVPILPLYDKLEALRYCFDDEAWED